MYSSQPPSSATSPQPPHFLEPTSLVEWLLPSGKTTASIRRHSLPLQLHPRRHHRVDHRERLLHAAGQALPPPRGAPRGALGPRHGRSYIKLLGAAATATAAKDGAAVAASKGAPPSGTVGK